MSDLLCATVNVSRYPRDHKSKCNKDINVINKVNIFRVTRKMTMKISKYSFKYKESKTVSVPGFKKRMFKTSILEINKEILRILYNCNNSDVDRKSLNKFAVSFTYNYLQL